MTLTTGAVIVERDTAVTAISETSAIADGAFDAGTKTVVAGADEVDLADAVLDIQFATAPDAGSDVKLYRRDMNIVGTNDATDPDTAYEHILVGSFAVDAVTTRQYISLPKIELVADQNFSIKNDGGQSTTGTTVVTITPRTVNLK